MAFAPRVDVLLLFYSWICSISYALVSFTLSCIFFFQAEDGIRDLVRSRGLGDVYKRQGQYGLVDVTGAACPVGVGFRQDRRVAEIVVILGLSLIHI